MKLKKYILAINFEASQSHFIKASLESNPSLKVITTESVYNGLLLIKNYIPNALIVDIIIPDSDKFILFKELQNDLSFQKIPIILLIDKVQKIHLNQLIQLNIVGIIAKPFEILKFAERVAEILEWK
ncbi:response regulator [Scytonema sp. NUACC26]|uniref:response regulator n=1 Tax=Scytonema sp. NUACC26 TaxID=3140176 RepID=UPI0034DC6AD0